MRTAPLNYLISLALGAVAWLLCAMVVGNYLGTNVPLLNATVEEFVGLYRVLLGVAVGVTVLITWLWIYSGSRPESASRLPSAKRRWDALLMTTTVLGLGTTFGIVTAFTNESFSMGQYAILVVTFSVVTWMLFWACSLAVSPRTVMNTVRGRR